MKILDILFVFALTACAFTPPVGPVPSRVDPPAFQKGESWAYELRDGYNGMLLRTFREEVKSLDDDQLSMHLTDDKVATGDTLVYTAEGNQVYIRAGRAALPVRYSPFKPAQAFPLEVGSQWQVNFVIHEQATGRAIRAALYGQAAGWEHVSVPAGEFDALKIRRQIYLEDEEFWRWGTRIYETDWYVPAVKRFVKHEDKSEFLEKSGHYPNNVRRGDWSVVELTKYERAR